MPALISVVIPIYNQEQYLGECLDSLLPQCTDEVEVVLVNDGSKDRSEAICREAMANYPAAQIRLINQVNSGALKSRQNGIRQSTGEYILFVDSDDALLPGALELLLTALHRERVDMLLFNATSDRETCTPNFAVPLPDRKVLRGEERYEVYRLLCGTDVLNNLWTKCIRRALFEKAILPEHDRRLTNGEDLYQILALAEVAESFAYLDNVLYFYRVMPTGISRIYNPYYFYSEKVVCARRLEYAQAWSRTDELVVGVRVQTYKIMREVARKLLLSGQPWPAIRVEMADFRADPFFRRYYLEANDAPDRRDIVLKGPFLLMWAVKTVYDWKKKKEG